MLRRNSSLIWLVAALAAGTMTDAGIADALAQSPPLTGSAAFGDWRSDKPGISRLIEPEDLPKPGTTPSVANRSRVVARGLHPPFRRCPQASRSSCSRKG